MILPITDCEAGMFNFIRAQELNAEDMLALYGLLKDENLLQVFFHDCEHMSFSDFLAYARSPANWFYMAENDGVIAGFGVINNSSNSGRAAFLHTCTFKECRGTDAVAAMQAFLLFIKSNSEIKSLAALIPATYHAARRLVKDCNFIEVARLPRAIRLYRGSTGRDVDGCLNILIF